MRIEGRLNLLHGIFSNRSIVGIAFTMAMFLTPSLAQADIEVPRWQCFCEVVQVDGGSCTMYMYNGVGGDPIGSDLEVATLYGEDCPFYKKHCARINAKNKDDDLCWHAKQVYEETWGPISPIR